jgi:hypothetical protein
VCRPAPTCFDGRVLVHARGVSVHESASNRGLDAWFGVVWGCFYTMVHRGGRMPPGPGDGYNFWLGTPLYPSTTINRASVVK